MKNIVLGVVEKFAWCVTLAALISLFNGCAEGRIVMYKPGQVEAAQAVLDMYGGNLDARDLPPIFWHDQDELTDCHKKHGDDRPYYFYSPGSGTCIYGAFMEDSVLDGPAWFEMAWPAGAVFAETSLSHELCHYWLLHTKGDSDQSHHDICFEGTSVQADNMLRVMFPTP